MVESKETIRNRVLARLRGGYEVAAAFSGQEALGKAADETPDLIIMDVMMIEMDGLAALKGLGLSSTAQAVQDALAVLDPNGHSGLDQADVVRKLFLHLQGKKK